MGIAEGMKSITENIAASYSARVGALNDLVADTRRTLADARKAVKDFAANRKKMSEGQARELANYVSDLSKTIGNMLKGFQADLKKVSANRAVMSEELRKKLARDAKEIQSYVKNRMKELKNTRAEMSEALKKDLARYVKDIASKVKDVLSDADNLLSEYRSDMKKAGAAWSSMSSALDKARSEGAMPAIKAGGKPTTAGASSEKKTGKKKTGKKKKKSKYSFSK